MGPPCLLLYINKSVMLGNYLQQTTSADVIFQMHFSWRFKGKMIELASLAQKNCTLYAFSSLMFCLLPKDNLFKNIFVLLFRSLCPIFATILTVNR